MKEEDAIMLEEYCIESITLNSYDIDGNTRVIASYEEANTVYHKDFSGVSITGRAGNTIELIPMTSIRSIEYKNKIQRDMFNEIWPSWDTCAFAKENALSYETACGFRVLAHEYKEKDMKECPYCGKTISIVI